MHDLKLMALDAEDLSVLAAHLQDAVLTVGRHDLSQGERRFALVANRFDWREVCEAGGRPIRGDGFTRRRTGVRFECVLDAKVSGLDPSEKGHGAVPADADLRARQTSPAAS